MQEPQNPDAEALAAALLQLSEHAGLLAGLGSRQAHEAAETRQRLDALTSLAAALKAAQADQADVLAGLAARLAEITSGSGGDPPGYVPSPSPRFWKLDGQAREDAIARLRAWVEQVYRPGYGQFAAALGSCWEQHPLCLYTLDWLSELWSALYLQPGRTTGTLAGQAEWQTRLLAAAAEQMSRETTRCPHATGRPARLTTVNHP